MIISRGLFLFFVLVLQILSPAAWSDPLLWQVENPRTGQKLYLFGSIHFGSEDLYPLSAPVMEAFRQSKALAVEVDLLATDHQYMSRLLSRVGHNPAGVTLESLMSSEDWLLLMQVARDHQVSAESFQKLKPWLAAVQLAAMQMRASGFDEGAGIDRYFLRMARDQADPKLVIELESLDSQLRIFSRLSLREQLLFLRQTLDEFSHGGDYLSQIAKAWQSGDEQVLQELIGGAFTGTPEAEAMYRVIFTDRNLQMAATVAGLLERGQTAFVVVGVGHMVGGDGLVALLQQRGFRIQITK